MTKKKTTRKPVLSRSVRIEVPKRPRKKIVVEFDGTSLTKQSFIPECDLRTQLKRFTEHGIAPPGRGQVEYGVQRPDFQETQFMIAQLKNQYENLPAEARSLFADSTDFVKALADESRQPELVEAGILQPDLDLPMSGEGNAPESPSGASNPGTALEETDGNTTVDENVPA